MGKYEFKLEPYAHQREALLHTWNKEFAALLMEYGTGKSKTTIDNAGILFEQGKIKAMLVVAPSGVHTQWVDEQVPEHLPDRIPVISRFWKSTQTKKFKASLEEFWKPYHTDSLKIFTVNVEATSTSKNAQNFILNFLKSFKTLLVYDEATRIKTPSAKAAKFATKIGKLAPYRRILTGSIVTREPFDCYAPYRFLNPGFWGGMSFHVFKHTYGKWKKNYRFVKNIKQLYNCPYCGQSVNLEIVRPGGVAMCKCPACKKICRNNLPWQAKKAIKNQGKFEYPVLIGYKDMPKLRGKVATCSFIARKVECLDLPEQIFSPIYAELNAEQKRLYAELKADLYTEYNDTELEVKSKIALTTRFQQIVGGFFPETNEPIGKRNPKLDALLYDLEDISTDAPVIVWARFRAEIEAIAKALSDRYKNKVVELYYGDTPKPERQRIIQDFKAGKIDFFVANPASAGTGLNLQKAYIQYYYSNSFKAEDRWQAESRTHRNGQKNVCLYKDIFIKGTVDDSIKKSTRRKKDLAEFFKNRAIADIV